LDQASPCISQDIWALFQRAYRIEAEIIGVENFPPLNRTLENIRSTESAFTGFFEGTTLTAISETQINGNSLSIDGLVVDPQFFRQGFGSQLLQFILNESHCDIALVETAAANKPAVCFYKRFGFKEIDRWETVEGIPLVKLVNQLM